MTARLHRDVSFAVENDHDILSVDVTGKNRKLQGTLIGVFLPCVQNILGVILFIRLTWMVGEAGIILTSLIVLICTSSTFLTALSLSSLATNGAIGAGGSYRILMKNLGPEVAGVVGLLHALGTTLATTMYSLGGVEALFDNFLPGRQLFPFDVQVIALMWTATLGAIVYAGMNYVAKIGPFFFIFVFMAIVFMILGVVLFGAYAWSPPGINHTSTGNKNIWANYSPDPSTGRTPSFITLIGLFFPAVSGIMAGANRSSVLLNPSESIPKGTILAIAATTALYLFVILLFGLIVGNDTLLQNKLVTASIAWPNKNLVAIGIIMSCVGAGLQSLAGSPQVLRAIANDSYIPILRIFKTRGNDEPRNAVLFCTTIACLCCLSGNLDYVTPVVAMFFLGMCASLNLACFLHAFLQSPDFRPTWRYFHWSTALLGFVFCIATMFLISVLYAVLVIVLILVWYYYMRVYRQQKDWGSAMFGLRMNQAMNALLELDEMDRLRQEKLLYDTTDLTENIYWRPQILVLCKVKEECEGEYRMTDASRSMLCLAGQLKKSRGFTMVTTLLHGCVMEPEAKSRVRSARDALENQMKEHKIRGFADALMSPGLLITPLMVLFQAAGLGMLSPNTVMLSWPQMWRSPAHMESFVGFLKSVLHMERVLIVTRLGLESPLEPSLGGTVDVWWLVHDGDILITLPYLLRRHKVWHKCSMRIFTVVDDIVDTNATRQLVCEHLEKLRIHASVEVVPVGTSHVRDLDQNRTVVSRANTNMGIPSVQSIFDLENQPKESSTSDENVLVEMASGPMSRYISNSDMGDDTKKYIAKKYGLRDQTVTRSARLASLFETEEDQESSEQESVESVDEQSIELPQKRTNNLEMGFFYDNELKNPAYDNVRVERRLHTASEINRCMRSKSEEADLVFLNLPLSRKMNTKEFIGYTETLTAGLEHIVMVRGVGTESIEPLN